MYTTSSHKAFSAAKFTKTFPASEAACIHRHMLYFVERQNTGFTLKTKRTAVHFIITSVFITLVPLYLCILTVFVQC